MPDLDFHVESAESRAIRRGADAGVQAARGRSCREWRGADFDPRGRICAVQIRIEPTRRHYEPGEQDALLEVFGRPSDWSRSLRSMLWTHASVIVPAFTSSTTVDLPVPCTFDFNIAATKYFEAMKCGDVPLCLLFSGTVFYHGVGRCAASRADLVEKGSELPSAASVWRAMMDQYYPNSPGSACAATCSKAARVQDARGLGDVGAGAGATAVRVRRRTNR
jgi:hypothetical protein